MAGCGGVGQHVIRQLFQCNMSNANSMPVSSLDKVSNECVLFLFLIYEKIYICNTVSLIRRIEQKSYSLAYLRHRPYNSMTSSGCEYKLFFNFGP